jgi:hypothetical protein
MLTINLQEDKLSRTYGRYKAPWIDTPKGKMRSNQVRPYRKHSSDLRFCGCNMCTWGLHHGSFGDTMTKVARRRFRHRVKQLLRRYHDDMEIPERQSVGYTD